MKCHLDINRNGKSSFNQTFLKYRKSDLGYHDRFNLSLSSRAFTLSNEGNCAPLGSSTRLIYRK